MPSRQIRARLRRAGPRHVPTSSSDLPASSRPAFCRARTGRLPRSHIPESERKDFLERGPDIFVQQVCLLKLHLAIEAGIQQENSRLPKDVLVKELSEALEKKELSIKHEILQELDIELPA